MSWNQRMYGSIVLIQTLDVILENVVDIQCVSLHTGIDSIDKVISLLSHVDAFQRPRLGSLSIDVRTTRLCVARWKPYLCGSHNIQNNTRRIRQSQFAFHSLWARRSQNRYRIDIRAFKKLGLGFGHKLLWERGLCRNVSVGHMCGQESRRDGMHGEE